EIVYLPEGRIGNVLCRPVLREYEIVYLGRSGAPPDRILPVTDLMLAVEERGLVLYSKRLKKRVIPRLTNAHGFKNTSLTSVYRFLCHLQNQHGTYVPLFGWGKLENFEFLPRLRTGRIILACARWQLNAEEVKKVKELDRYQSFQAIQELRHRRRLPRWVVLPDGDNFLPVDLDNALSVDALVHVLKRLSRASLLEMYPSPEELCITSSEGRFQHELAVPFARVPRREAADSSQSNGAVMTARGAIIERSIRVLPPGNDWLFLKLYDEIATLD